jgi:hypothetical protein
MIPAQVAIKSSTQSFIEIEEIKDSLVILKDGSACMIINITAVNFGLLSESEQDAMIYAYAGLLNSLSFSVQIIIRSKRKDITSYLNLLKDQENKQLYGPLKEQMRKYRLFVETTVRVNNVLDQKFYIVLPFSPLELGAGHAMNMLSRKKGLPYSMAYILDRAKTTLYPKRDHLLRQLNRLGLKAHQLSTAELIQLFYDIYNPGSLGTENIGGIASGIMAPMVEANIGNEPRNQQSKSPIKNDLPAEKAPSDLPMMQFQSPNPIPPANADKELSLPTPGNILIEEKKDMSLTSEPKKEMQ